MIDLSGKDSERADEIVAPISSTTATDVGGSKLE